MHYKFDPPSLSLPLRWVQRFLPPLWNKITDNSKRGFSEKSVLSFELKKMIINMLELEIMEMEKLMRKDLSKWMFIEK